MCSLVGRPMSDRTSQPFMRRAVESIHAVLVLVLMLMLLIFHHGLDQARSTVTIDPVDAG